MEIRKVITGGVMIGALSAAGLGLSGVASASTQCHYNCPKPPSQSVTITKTTTVTKTASTSVSNTTGNFGNGNTQQTASGNAGAVNNPQVGFGTNLGLQVPINANTGSSTGGAASDVHKARVDTSANSSSDQYAKQYQTATGNESYNSTKVNNANGNGNGSSVSIGASN